MKTSGNRMAKLLEKLNVDNDTNVKKSILKR
jgi:hypothetical protein